MKNILQKNTVQMLAAAAVCALAAAPAQAETLRLGDWQSTTHIVSIEGTQKWMRKVEELTGGEIAFNHFPAQQAATAKELLQATENGVLDAALVGPLYNPDILPLNSVLGLPGLYKSAAHGTEAMQAMLAEGPLRQEFLDAGVVPIFGFVLPPYQVLSKDARLGGPDDWKGLDIRTSGSTQEMVARDLGAVGVSLPGPDVYTALETGRLDGVLFPLASAPAYNLQEVVKHISTNGSFGGYSFAIVVNADRFGSLPDSVQSAMIEAGKEAAATVAKAQDDSIGELTAQWKADGVNVYEFTDEEKAKIDAALANVQQEWLDRIGTRHPQAGDVLSQFKALTSN